MSTKDERLQIRLPGALFRKFKAYAALQGKSMSEVTEELLQEWLTSQKPIPDAPCDKDSEE